MGEAIDGEELALEPCGSELALGTWASTGCKPVQAPPPASTSTESFSTAGAWPHSPAVVASSTLGDDGTLWPTLAFS